MPRFGQFAQALVLARVPANYSLRRRRMSRSSTLVHSPRAGLADLPPFAPRPARARQGGILVEGIQAENSSKVVVTITDLTLKLYNGTTLGATAVLTPEPLTLSTNPGAGSTDYLFVLDAVEAAAFDALIAGN